MNEALVNGSGSTSLFAVIWFVPSLQHVGQRSDLVFWNQFSSCNTAEYCTSSLVLPKFWNHIQRHGKTSPYVQGSAHLVSCGLTVRVSEELAAESIRDEIT
jgi:hypothetical protein